MNRILKLVQNGRIMDITITPNMVKWEDVAAVNPSFSHALNDSSYDMKASWNDALVTAKQLIPSETDVATQMAARGKTYTEGYLLIICQPAKVKQGN